MDEFKKFILGLLDIAVNAPSGHNCQPWKFGVKEHSLFIWNLPNNDKTLFNYLQRGSLTANGAMLENLIITSSKMGYEAKLHLFPDKGDRELVARVDFAKGGKRYKYEDLYRYILKRTTNRKPFKQAPLSVADESEIHNFIVADQSNESALNFLSDEKRRNKAAELFSVGDRVLFDNAHLHQALYSIVNWTAEEEQERRSGLYVNTKELPRIVKIIFKYVVSSRRLLNALSFLDLPTKMARKRKKLYLQSSAICLVTASDGSAEAFVTAGRTLQRLWLKLTSLGISLQPISVGLLYLGQRLQEEIPHELSEAQYKYVKKAYSEVLGVFRVENRTPSFSFRIGYADPPTASSLKKPPEVTFL